MRNPFRSRKFNTAVTGLLTVLLTVLVGKYGLGFDESTIAMLAGSIVIIVGTLIGSIAVEDHGAKLGADWTDTIPRDPPPVDPDPPDNQ